MFVEKFLDYGKLPFLWKISLIKEKSLFAEKFHDHEKKKKNLWKVSLIRKNIFVWGKLFWLWKANLCQKRLWSRKIFVCGKLSWLQKKMKGFLILKTNTCVEIIKILLYPYFNHYTHYFLSISFIYFTQKLNLLPILQ